MKGGFAKTWVFGDYGSLLGFVEWRKAYLGSI